MVSGGVFFLWCDIDEPPELFIWIDRMHHLVVELRAAGARLTSAEILLIPSEAACAPGGPSGLGQRLAAGEHPPDLARCGHGRDGVWHRLLVTVLADVDDGVLWKAEVSAEVVDTLHPSFTGIIYQSTLINVCRQKGGNPIME